MKAGLILSPLLCLLMAGAVYSGVVEAPVAMEPGRGLSSDFTGAKALTADTPLMAASRQCDLGKARQLLSMGVPLDVRDQSGSTALVLACIAGCEPVAKILIERGADPNAKASGHGLTPLLISSAKGMDRTVELLVANGADVNARGIHGQTPLYLAAYSGFEKIVEALVKAGADPNLTDKQNQSPLYFAAHNGDVETVKLLIKHGALINKRAGKMKHDPLMAASIAGNYEVAKILLEKGAQFHIPDEQGMTALMFAGQNGHTDIVNLMLGKYAHPMLTPFVKEGPENKSSLDGPPVKQ